jgi:hypothetical protein
MQGQQPGGKYNLAHFVPESSFSAYFSFYIPRDQGNPCLSGIPDEFAQEYFFSLLKPIIALLSLLCYYRLDSIVIASMTQMA